MTARAQEIVLVRHGETEWSSTGRHTGRTDLELTSTGRRQAAQLGSMLADRAFALVLSSPLTRARETYVLSGLAKPVEFDDDLLEWEYGVYEGRRTAEIRTEIPGWSVWTHPLPQGESVDAVGERADRIVQRCLHAPGDVALFAHGHVLRILAARWLGLPADVGRHLALDTATISTLSYEREERVISRWNERCHLAETAPDHRIA